MSSMYDNVVGVISKPPDERPTSTIQALLPWFKKKSDVFDSLKTDVVVDILRNCAFVTRPRDYIIIKQGDKGDCFYIILNGTVSIYINSTISDEEDESKIAQHSREARATFTEKGELDRSKYGNFIVQFFAGKSFGELALISKNCIRNASIIADESTDLLVVSKDLYNRCLRAAQAAEFESRQRFVKEHAVFRYWPPKYKKQLAMSLEKVKVAFQGHICKQGEAVDKMYFMVRGQAKILVDGILHETQYSQFYPLEDPDDVTARQELEMEAVQHLPKKKETVNHTQDRMVSVAPSAQRKRESIRKQIELSIVGENETIGDTEIVLELKTYLQTVECCEECEVYALSMKNYERLVAKRNPKTIAKLRHHAEVKLHSRISHLLQDQLPILKTLLFKMDKLDKSQNPHRKKQERQVPAITVSVHDPVPHRGPLIDMYGPGTVFYRSQMRDQAKQKLKNKPHFGGAHGINTPNIYSNYMRDSHTAPPRVRISHVDDVISSGAEQEDSDEDYDYEREVTAFITEKEIHPYGTLFMDYKSSDKAMTMLEDRIKDWYTTLSANKTRRTGPKTAVKLERVQITRGKGLVPGRQVILRKRRPIATSNSCPQAISLIHPSKTITVPSKEPLHSRRLPSSEARITSSREIHAPSGNILSAKPAAHLPHTSPEISKPSGSSHLNLTQP